MIFFWPLDFYSDFSKDDDDHRTPTELEFWGEWGASEASFLELLSQQQ